MFSRLTKILLLPFALFAVVSTTPVLADDDGPLNAEMKQMGDNFKRSGGAKNIEQMQDYVNQFRSHVELALKAGYNDDPEEFSKGINQLLTGLDGVQDAIDAGNLSLAKKRMKKLGDIRKKYHEQFGV